MYVIFHIPFFLFAAPCNLLTYFPLSQLDEDDDDMPDLKKRLAKLNEQLASTNLDSSPDQSTGELV